MSFDPASSGGIGGSSARRIVTYANVYNPKNKVLPASFVEDNFRKYGLTVSIQSMDAFQVAFTHNSYLRTQKGLVGIGECPQNCVPLQKESYELLEWLGDAFIDYVVARLLHSRYPLMDEGKKTQIKSGIVNNESLAKIALSMGFADYILISDEYEKIHGRTKTKLLANVFEAWMAAIHQNVAIKDIYAAIQYVKNIFEDHIDFSELVYFNQNYVDRVQHHFQRAGRSDWLAHMFRDELLEREDGTRLYRFTAHDVDNLVIGMGVSDVKKKAKQIAAKEALGKLGYLEDDEL